MASVEERHPWEARFVQNMAQRRKELGMTQAVLARLMSEQGLAFHQQTVQRIENGERPVRLNEAVLIVQALGLGEPGNLGLDSAIDPTQSESIAHYLLEAAVARAQQLIVAAELSRAAAYDRVTEALGDVFQALDSYRTALAEGAERDQRLIFEAAVEYDFLKRYREGLSAVAQLQKDPRSASGEHPEAT